MTHASGILPDKELIDALAAAKEGRKPRLMKIEIDHDRLVLRSSIEGMSDVQAGVSQFHPDNGSLPPIYPAPTHRHHLPVTRLLACPSPPTPIAGSAKSVTPQKCAHFFKCRLWIYFGSLGGRCPLLYILPG